MDENTLKTLEVSVSVIVQAPKNEANWLTEAFVENKVREVLSGVTNLDREDTGIVSVSYVASHVKGD